MSAPALVAPDSFKGTFTAAEVAGAIGRGLRAGGRATVELPVADGGEGTLDALVTALGGDRLTAPAHDPLGRAIEAGLALLPGRATAIVETAAASGLGLVREGDRDPLAASTYGTGELIAAAADAGAKEVLLAVGGSATTDGGAGALEALEGVDVGLTVLCDVRTPFEHAARVFGPQKGADAAAIAELEDRLRRLAEGAPRDPRGVPLTGAAGGLAGGLWAHRGARLVPGAAYVLDTVGFDEAMRAAAWIVTGEGRLDTQTLQGKVVGEVATRARQGGVACHAVVGQVALEPFAQRILDLASVTEATTLAELEAAGRALAD